MDTYFSTAVSLAGMARQFAISATNKPIDEISLLFEDEQELMAFASLGKDLNLWFAESEETQVCRWGGDEVYKTSYQFIKPDPDSEWRIEAMAVLDGHAPLHFEHLALRGSPCVIHASYKLPSWGAYKAELNALQQKGWDLAKEYANDYGIFSYFPLTQMSRNGSQRTSKFYIKPRVNMRDQ